jgi:hypothetical protein
MKTIHVLISEMDSSFHACSSKAELDRFEKTRNKPIRVSPQLTIKPWSPLCNIEFPRERSVDHFNDFLHTKSGIEFANRHLCFNPLYELKKLLALLPKSVRVYVLGGLALDGYLGAYTRPHNDADLICWRKDIQTIRRALKKLGYGIKEHCFDDDPKRPYMLETDEDNPTISFFVIDKAPNSSFRFKRDVLPEKYLGHDKVNLEGVEFAPVGLPFLHYLNTEGAKSLRRIKQNNPKLYSGLGVKIANNRNDRKMIKRLLSR